jgi:hypothetical protein
MPAEEKVVHLRKDFNVFPGDDPDRSLLGQRSLVISTSFAPGICSQWVYELARITCS